MTFTQQLIPIRFCGRYHVQSLRRDTAVLNVSHSEAAMLTFSRTLIIVLLALQVACTTGRSIQTYDDYNPSFDFSRYQTFSFISENPMIVGGTARPVSPLLETHFMRAIRGDLERKGFRYLNDSESADLAISFTIGSREQIRVDQYPVSYRGGYSRYHRYYGYGPMYGTETRVRQYTQGQLAIDIFDVATKTPAFHGSSSLRITDQDRANPGELLNQVVTETLDGFPPHRVDFARPTLVPLQGQ